VGELIANHEALSLLQCKQIYIRIRTLIFTLMYIFLYTYKYIHTYTHIYIHIDVVGHLGNTRNI
jgi:hypothetical protein